MKLYIYRGLGWERVPKDVTHAIVDESVTIIKRFAFYACTHIVSVIMGDNVKIIESGAFYWCTALRFLRVSKTLEFIGDLAFCNCDALEALFLPLTVKSIGAHAFYDCRSLRLLMLPNGIDLSNVSDRIIPGTAIENIARAAGVVYERDGGCGGNITNESNTRVNEWLIHHMEDVPFHKVCYTSFITTKQINNYLIENGNDSAPRTDTIHDMTPLHTLTTNPNAPADSIAALLDSNMEAVFSSNNQ